MAIANGEFGILARDANGELAVLGPVKAPENGEMAGLIATVDGELVAGVIGGEGVGFCQCGPRMLLTISGMVDIEKWHYWNNGTHIVCPAYWHTYKGWNAAGLPSKVRKHIQKFQIGRRQWDRNWDTLTLQRVWQQRTGTFAGGYQRVRFDARKASRKANTGTGSPSVTQWHGVANSTMNTDGYSVSISLIKNVAGTCPPTYISGVPLTWTTTMADVSGMFQTMSCTSTFGGSAPHTVDFSWQPYDIDEWRSFFRDKVTDWDVSTYTDSTHYRFSYECGGAVGTPNNFLADLRPY